jgi:hypothetical protein
LPVIFADTQEHEQTMADLAYNLTTYFNGCFFDALDNSLHVMVDT